MLWPPITHGSSRAPRRCSITDTKEYTSSTWERRRRWVWGVISGGLPRRQGSDAAHPGKRRRLGSDARPREASPAPRRQAPDCAPPGRAEPPACPAPVQRQPVPQCGGAHQVVERFNVAPHVGLAGLRAPVAVHVVRIHRHALFRHEREHCAAGGGCGWVCVGRRGRGGCALHGCQGDFVWPPAAAEAPSPAAVAWDRCRRVAAADSPGRLCAAHAGAPLARREPPPPHPARSGRGAPQCRGSTPARRAACRRAGTRRPASPDRARWSTGIRWRSPWRAWRRACGAPGAATQRRRCGVGAPAVRAAARDDLARGSPKLLVRSTLIQAQPSHCHIHRG